MDTRRPTQGWRKTQKRKLEGIRKYLDVTRREIEDPMGNEWKTRREKEKKDLGNYEA